MTSLLEISRLRVRYGVIEALHGVSLIVHRGEIVTVIGANGAGKTTLLKAISGLVPATEGTIRYEGEQSADLERLKPHEIAAAGIRHVPEGRRIFQNLTVRENLSLGAYLRRDGVDQELRSVFSLFPRLEERLDQNAGTLSGGEQQMLAIGRILRTGARLLLLDEPTEGLAPVIIQQIGKTIRSLKEQGFTILLVEQNFRFASTVADRYYVMEHGRIIDQFANSELDANVEKLHDYLGV